MVSRRETLKRNISYFTVACKNSLGNDTECRIYARDGECQINPDWMNIFCEKNCGICSSTSSSPTVTVPTGIINLLFKFWSIQ